MSEWKDKEAFSLDEYQLYAGDFALPQAWSMQYLLPGLMGEVGELASLWAKAERDGSWQKFHENFEKELGDVLWFVAMLARQRGGKLSSVAKQNLDKLASRKQRGTIQGSGDDR